MGERCSSYYIWNIVFVYFLIIFAHAGMIAYPYNETRFDFAMTLALTTVAFKFVTSTLVPKVSYLTYLDRYMLSGLAILGVRFIVDVCLQVFMTVPIGEEGARGECTEANENEMGMTPC